MEHWFSNAKGDWFRPIGKGFANETEAKAYAAYCQAHGFNVTYQGAFPIVEPVWDAPGSAAWCETYSDRY